MAPLPTRNPAARAAAIVHPVQIVGQISLQALDLLSGLAMASFEQRQRLDHLGGVSLLNALTVGLSPRLGIGGSFPKHRRRHLPDAMLDVVQLQDQQHRDGQPSAAFWNPLSPHH